MTEKKLEDGKGITRKKKLTNAKIDAMQKFYGNAIRDNKGDVPKMSGEVRELLGHYSSTIEKHLQSDCPKDSKSWYCCQRNELLVTLTYEAPRYPKQLSKF